MKVTSQGCGKQADSGVEIEREFTRASQGDDFYQLVDEVTVGLEEGSGADAMVGMTGVVGEKPFSIDQEGFGRGGFRMRAGLRAAKRDHSSDGRQSGPELLHEHAQVRPVSRGSAGKLDQQLRVVGIGEKLDF